MEFHVTAQVDFIGDSTGVTLTHDLADQDVQNIVVI